MVIAKNVILLSPADAVDIESTFINLKNVIFKTCQWEAETITNDPQIYLYNDSNKPLDSLRYRCIEFTLYVDKNTQGQLIWWLPDGRWQTSFNFRIKKGWHNYCFDMKNIVTTGKNLGSGIVWEGLISKLRLDPGEREDIKIKLRSVKAASYSNSEITPMCNNSIELDPQAKDNTKLNWEDCKTLPVVVKSKPTLIYAEISTKCNLRCRMCGRYNYEIPASREGFMSKEVFLKLSKLFVPGTRLALFGRGESLMHPDFINFLEIAYRSRMKVVFNTNGLLLTPKIAKAMVENEQECVTFSCSAGTPATYCKIHGADKWGKLWDNIKILNEAKLKYGVFSGPQSKYSNPVIYLEFVSQLSNIKELPILLRRALSYNLAGLVAINLTAHSSVMEEERMNIPANLALADTYYKEALDICKRMVKVKKQAFDLRLPNEFSMLDKKFMSPADTQILSKIMESSKESMVLRSENFCLEPWRTFYVRYDGTTAPCVITGRSMGDLNKNTAEEIWNGETYQKFRTRMKEKSKPYECLRCHFFPGPKKYNIELSDHKAYEEL